MTDLNLPNEPLNNESLTNKEKALFFDDKSLTTRLIEGDISKRFVIIGNHPDPKITEISRIARVIAQTSDYREILGLMISDLSSIEDLTEKDWSDPFTLLGLIPRIKNYVNSFALNAKAEETEKSSSIENELIMIVMVYLLSSSILFEKEVGKMILNIDDNYNPFNLLPKFNVMLIDHFMIYKNYAKLYMNPPPIEKLSPDHIQELIILHRFCFQKLAKKYNLLEEEYCVFDNSDGQEWAMNLNNDFESELEKMCQANNFHFKIHPNSYHNPLTQSKINIPECKIYDIPSSFYEQVLEKTYEVTKIIERVEKYYQQCDEMVYKFDQGLWLLSILHYVMTNDLPDLLIKENHD